MDLSNPNTRQKVKELFSKAIEVIDRLGPLIKENGVLKRRNVTQEKVINDLRFDIGSLKAQVQTPKKTQAPKFSVGENVILINRQNAGGKVVSMFFEDGWNYSVSKSDGSVIDTIEGNMGKSISAVSGTRDTDTHQKLISALSTKADALSKQADAELKLTRVSSENDRLKTIVSELEDESSKFFEIQEQMELLKNSNDRLLGQNELFKNKISGLESMLEEAADSVQECRSECEHARIKQFQNLKDCEESNDGLNQDIEDLKIRLESGDILAEEKNVLIGEINRLRARDSSRRYNTVFTRFNRRKPTAPPSDENFQ